MTDELYCEIVATLERICTDQAGRDAIDQLIRVAFDILNGDQS